MSVRWFWLGLLLTVSVLLYVLSPILMPFLSGILLAYMGDPLVDRLERYRLSRTGAVVVVFVFFTLLLLIGLLIVIPLLGRQLVHLYQTLPSVFDRLQLELIPWLEANLGLTPGLWQIEQLKTVLVGHLGSATDVAGLLLAKVTASSLALLALIGNLLLIPVVGFYLMRDWDLLMARLRLLLPRDKEPTIVHLAVECHEVLGAFLRGQLLVMLALGAIYSVGLMVIGLELGLLIGVLAGLASIVPYMGFVVGIGSAVAAVLFQVGVDPYLLLGVGAVFMVGQMLEGMLLTPLLVGDRIGLHPVAVIFAVLAGGQLFGFTGILLALPVAAVIMVLLRHMHELYQASGLYQKNGAP